MSDQQEGEANSDFIEENANTNTNTNSNTNTNTYTNTNTIGEDRGGANSDFIGFAGLRLGKLWRHPQNRIDEEIQIQIQMQIQIQAIVCACESC